MTVQILQIPPPTESIREAYQQLIADINTMIDTIAGSRFKSRLQCRPGCASCCMQFSVLPLEAALVAEALHEHTPMSQKNGDSCLLLVDNLCQVYAVRPIICRTQGMPLGYVDEYAGTIEVSACPLNFPDDFPLTHDDLLYMDQFNSRLAELNLQYCRATGLDPEKRIPLADLVPAG